MGHVQRVTIKFYSHIFSSDLNVLYLFKLPAPPRAVLLGEGAEYTGGIPFPARWSLPCPFAPSCHGLSGLKGLGESSGGRSQRP